MRRRIDHQPAIPQAPYPVEVAEGQLALVQRLEIGLAQGYRLAAEMDELPASARAFSTEEG